MIPHPAVSAILDAISNILQRWKNNNNNNNNNNMPVKFLEYNYCWKLSEKRLLTVILISSWILLIMAAILDTIENSTSFWIKPMFHFNRLYHLDSKQQ